MAISCIGNSKFTTSEARAKSILRTQGIIDKYLNIKKLNDFRVKVTEWSKDAKERFGIQERLFTEDGGRAVPNKTAFRNIDNSKGIFYQEKGVEMSQASPKTIGMLKDLLKRIGVDISVLANIPIDNEKSGANGAALLTQKLIQIVQGKELEALPEETMHFVVAIIKQTNPKLYKKLMGEINQYKILKEVFNTYGGTYIGKDGKPDVVKLKEEAIAKVLAETIIKNIEGTTEHPELIEKVKSWWREFIEFFKGLISRSGFDQISMDIISGKEIGTAEDIREKEGEVFLQKSVQDNIWDKLNNISQSIEKRDDGYYINDKKVPKRVSDLNKSWYEKLRSEKALTDTEFTKAVNDLKAEKGTAGHAALEYAFHILVDDEGYIRETALDDSDYDEKNPKFSREMYELLKSNLKERLSTFPPNTRFKSEITVYNPKVYGGLAGTIDFLAVEETGKVHILDWKFMNLNTTRYEDVPWYKVTSWQNQMTQYKLILQNVYGIKSQEFGQTRMIPIYAHYSEGIAKQNILPRLMYIKIGDVKIENIEENYLLPVGLEEEKTGNVKIDNLLEKLNAEYKKLSQKSVLPSEKEEKAKQLNALFSAIRQLQIKGNLKPLLQQAKLLNKYIENIIKTYDAKFKGKDVKAFKQSEVNAYAEELQEAQASIGIYADLYTNIKSLFADELSKEDKKLKKDVRKTTENAKDLQGELNDLLDTFTADVIAKRENIEQFLSPDKVVKGITKWFASTATLQIKSMELLYKLANKAFAYSGMDTLNENKILEQLKNSYGTWANNKGISKKDYFNIIKKKDKNELIDEFDKDFFITLKTKIEEKDFKWIKDNIDVDKYKEFLTKRKETEIERAKNRHRIGNAKEIENEIKFEINKINSLYDTSATDSVAWLLYDHIKKFPKESWQSTEWKELIHPNNKPAKDFYDYIVGRNKIYQELGYIGKYESRVFLPFVRKGLTEKLITGGNIKLGEQFLTDISIDEGDIGYGKIDPQTGKLINSLPKYFTTNIEGELSTDLFRTMAFYNEAAIKYQYLKEIEKQVTAIVAVEKNKKVISTSMFGKTEYKDGQLQYSPDNIENSKLVEDMMKAIIYGQKYITSETFDQLLGKLGTWGETLNKKLGTNIFPEDLSDRQLSVNKIITQLNNTFQLNTLGLNLLSASSNFFGGNTNSIINAGTYFTKSDYMAAEGMIFMNKFNGTNHKKMIGALEYFMPLTENYNRELSKRLSLNTLTAESLQDGLMYFMRQSDWNVQTSNFYAYLKNAAVIDGEVVNVREYLRASDKYKNKYSLTKTEREALNVEFEAEVASILEEKSVFKLAEIVDDKFVIPGVDQKSQSIVELRRKVQQINKNALGNLSEDDLRMINLNIYGKSFMVFKNWIPRLVDVRMGNLKYNSASDAYEWGRMRTVFKVISEDWLKSLGNLYGSLAATESGVDFMRQLYEKKKEEYELETGKTLEMTEDQFLDLVRQNIKSQLLDVIFLTTLFILIAGLKAGAPDDDEDDAVKSQYRFIVRAADKFRDELMYFYDPTSISGLISKGIFPSMGLIENFTKGVKNFFIENWAIASGNEQLEKDNKVIKYWMKTFPFTNQMVGYLPMFYPDMAKDLGIKIQSNYGIR